MAKKAPLSKLHKKEEKLHHKAERAMEADEKVHKMIDKKGSKEGMRARFAKLLAKNRKKK